MNESQKNIAIVSLKRSLMYLQERLIIYENRRSIGYQEEYSLEDFKDSFNSLKEEVQVFFTENPSSLPDL